MDAQPNPPTSSGETKFLRGGPWRRGRKIGALALAVALVVFGTGWFAHAPLLRQLASWWVVSDPLVHADAIVVLGGSLEVRPFAAAALYKRGFANKILISNVPLGRAERLGFIPSHAELNRDILVKLGVPSSAIALFGENNSSTFEEAVALRAWAAQSRVKSVIVPTDMFDTRRTRWIFDRELKPAGISVIVHAFPPPGYGTNDWWRNRYGLIDFDNEVLKYLYYRLAY
jgi:uncharacterized SAM-binding protein YcdF (DUF218 family)